MITNHASFYNKNHQDTHFHNFTMQFTELTFGFKDCIISNNETKWNNVLYEWLLDENQTTSVRLKDFY